MKKSPPEVSKMLRKKQEICQNLQKVIEAGIAVGSHGKYNFPHY